LVSAIRYQHDRRRSTPWGFNSLASDMHPTDVKSLRSQLASMQLMRIACAEDTRLGTTHSALTS
jgi:hypothetical protein